MKKSIEQRLASILGDREHGSRWLVREAIVVLRDFAIRHTAPQDEHMQLLYRYGREIAHARPAMAALAGAVGQVLSVDGGPEVVVQEANRLLEELDTATQHIAEHARPYMRGLLMTCSISGTVLDVLNATRHTVERITVLEGRPRYEGRDMARIVSEMGIPVTLITDAQADIFLPQCQGIVVGADTILANGDVLNKAGTALLAWAARGHSVPLYVLCETLKISPRSGFDESWLEEKEANEVLAQPIPGVSVRNFYFDRTPYALISKVITEQGIMQLSEIQRIAARAARNVQKLMNVAR